MSFYDNPCYKSLVDRLLLLYEKRDRDTEEILRAGDKEACFFHAFEKRKQLIDAIGPKEKMSWECSLRGRKEYDCFFLERAVIFPRSGEAIPVNVYIPKNDSPSHPAVLVSVGHCSAGKAEKNNQLFCQELAARGILAAVYDPLYQGERNPFDEKELEKAYPGVEEDIRVVNLHMQAGNLCYLLGRNLGEYFLQDSLRVIDYLASRRDVDENRIGAAGQSGGGLQTMYAAVFDKRVSCYSPIQSVTKQRITLTEHGIGDCEQSLLAVSREKGFDYGDLLWAAFPKPCFLNGARNDYLGIEGLHQVREEMEEAYRLFQKKNAFEWGISKGGHVLNGEARRLSVDYFCRRFGLPAAPPTKEASKRKSRGDGPGEKEGSRKIQGLKMLPLKPRELSCLQEGEKRMSLKEVLAGECRTLKKRRHVRKKEIRAALLERMDNTRKSGWEPEIVYENRSRNRLIVAVLSKKNLWLEKEFSGDLLWVVPMGAPEAFDKYERGYAGYDVVTGIFNAGILLGEGYASAMAAQIVDAVQNHCGKREYAERILLGEGPLTTAVLMAGAVSRFKETVLFDSLEPFEKLFGEPFSTVCEGAMEPGLLQIADLQDLVFCNKSVRYEKPGPPSGGRRQGTVEDLGQSIEKENQDKPKSKLS